MENKCTVYRTTSILAKRWTLPIVHSTYKGKNFTRRYGEIKRELKGITPKILSARLKELEKEGILKRKVDHDSIPVRTFYTLTDSGKDLMLIIKDIKKWGLKWKYDNKKCEATNCKDCDSP